MRSTWSSLKSLTLLLHPNQNHSFVNMSSATILYFLLFTFTFLLFKLFLHPKQNTLNHKKPPGPPRLPIIGNLHLLGKLPHRALETLSKKYGPIMSLQLGQVPAIIISSSKAAELFLKTHDLVFASRPKIQASKIFSYGSVGFAFSEYGPYWRSVRKLCTLKLLSASKVEMFAPIRKDELDVLVKSLKKAALVGEAVNVSDVVQTLIEDIVFKMILGRSKYQQFDMKMIVRQTMILFGAFNLADYVTWMGYFDLQGITRACKKTSKELDKLLEVIVTDHEQAINVDTPHHEQDFVDTLLSTMLQTVDLENEQNNVINRTDVKAVLLDLTLAGIDTSTSVVEWALSELLRNSRVMKNLQDEIQNEIGCMRMIEEKDLKKLSYLDMVVDEILRLYPVGPLLVPRECRENITIDGYFIEKKSRVIVNAWAKGRDPDVWSQNAEEFYPERFIDKKMNFHGQEFECIPFGSGRRRCPGIHFGLTTVKLVLAQLVHCFNWELPHDITPSNLNMEEKFGLTMPRAHHLYAIPRYRLVTN